MTPTSTTFGPQALSLLSVDPEALTAAASHLSSVAEMLGTGGTGGAGGTQAEAAVLTAPVPQAALFCTALNRVRGEQATTMAGFTDFYRASERSLATTASQVRRGEDSSSARFAGIQAGATGAAGAAGASS